MEWFATSDRSENVAQASLRPKAGQSISRYRIVGQYRKNEQNGNGYWVTWIGNSPVAQLVRALH